MMKDLILYGLDFLIFKIIYFMSNQYFDCNRFIIEQCIYIRNYITDADVIVTRGGKNARIVDILAGYVRDQLTLDHKKSGNRE